MSAKYCERFIFRILIHITGQYTLHLFIGYYNRFICTCFSTSHLSEYSFVTCCSAQGHKPIEAMVGGKGREPVFRHLFNYHKLFYPWSGLSLLAKLKATYLIISTFCGSVIREVHVSLVLLIVAWVCWKSSQTLCIWTHPTDMCCKNILNLMRVLLGLHTKSPTLTMSSCPQCSIKFI